ncbi:hypothetical protein GCM10029964_042590 [Kibdelosporangium lantanae]
MALFRRTRPAVQVVSEREAVRNHVMWIAGHGPQPADGESVGDVTLAEVVSLLLRRRLGTRSDARDVTAFVAGALRRAGRETGGRQARAAEAIIRGELGEPELADPRVASLDEIRDLSWVLLRVLVADWAPTPEQVTAVLAHAERSTKDALDFLRRNGLTAAEAPDWHGRKRAGSWTESRS